MIYKISNPRSRSVDLDSVYPRKSDTRPTIVVDDMLWWVGFVIP